MLPDGAERQPADWTVFFLNQTPFNTIKPVLALVNDDGPGTEDEDARMSYVIHSVPTKLDKTASVEYTVNELITEASDPANLALMYTGTRSFWSGACRTALD